MLLPLPQWVAQSTYSIPPRLEIRHRLIRFSRVVTVNPSRKSAAKSPQGVARILSNLQRATATKIHSLFQLAFRFFDGIVLLAFGIRRQVFISFRIWNGENCGFKLLLKNGLPPFHLQQCPTQVAFPCFQSDGALRRLIQEDRDTLRFSDDYPDQSKERLS